MPDRDVFNRHVERGWQTASRFVFGSDDNAHAVPKLQRALAVSLKQGGCPGLDAIASIVADLLIAPDRRTARMAARERLEQVRRAAGSTRTDIAIRVARRIVADPDQFFSSPEQRLNRCEVAKTVTERVLLAIAEAKHCPGVLMQELVEREKLPFQTLRGRRDRAMAGLASSPQFSRIVDQMLKEPRGRLVKAPRSNLPRPSQESLLAMALDV